MMNKAISKLCAGLCFVGALALVPACGGESGKDGACADGQKQAEVNGTLGCYDECTDGMCGAGFTCNSGLCIAASGGNNGGNNGGTNNGGNNGGTNNGGNNGGTNNGGNNGGTNNGGNNGGGPIDPATTALCESYVDLLYGSCLDSCTLDADFQQALDDATTATLNGDGSATNPACDRYLTDNPSVKDQIQAFVDENTCETIASIRCGEWGLTTECNCATPTNLGAPCTDDTQCMGGDLDGLCFTEADGAQPGGECLAGPCPGLDPASFESGFLWPSDACGDGNACSQVVPQDGSDSYGLCIQGCDASTDCRNDQACQIGNLVQVEQGVFEVVRVCGEACAANTDCGEGGRCNAGMCEFQCDNTPDPNNPDAPTLLEICNGTGGTCTVDANDSMEYCVY